MPKERYFTTPVDTQIVPGSNESVGLKLGMQREEGANLYELWQFDPNATITGTTNSDAYKVAYPKSVATGTFTGGNIFSFANPADGASSGAAGIVGRCNVGPVNPLAAPPAQILTPANWVWLKVRGPNTLVRCGSTTPVVGSMVFPTAAGGNTVDRCTATPGTIAQEALTACGFAEAAKVATTPVIAADGSSQTLTTVLVTLRCR